MGSNFGTGGMQTKLIAADLATAAGVATVILNGMTPSNIVKVVERGIPDELPHHSSVPATIDSICQARHSTPLVAATVSGTATPGGVSAIGTPGTPSTPVIPPQTMNSSISSIASEDLQLVGHPALNDPPHTLFLPFAEPLPSRKWSILHALHPSGSLIMDEGAYRAITRSDSGGRLLPAGVIGLSGNWERMQAVRLLVRTRRRRSNAQNGEVPATHEGEDSYEDIEVGRGLANYTSIECERIKGLKT